MYLKLFGGKSFSFLSAEGKQPVVITGEQKAEWIINFYCVELTNIFIEIRDP